MLQRQQSPSGRWYLQPHVCTLHLHLRICTRCRRSATTVRASCLAGTCKENARRCCIYVMCLQQLTERGRPHKCYEVEGLCFEMIMLVNGSRLLRSAPGRAPWLKDCSPFFCKLSDSVWRASLPLLASEVMASATTHGYELCHASAHMPLRKPF